MWDWLLDTLLLALWGDVVSAVVVLAVLAAVVAVAVKVHRAMR